MENILPRLESVDRVVMDVLPAEPSKDVIGFR